MLQLRQDTVALQQRHLQMSRTGIPSPATIQSIENATRWGLGDLNNLKQVTTVVSKEIDQLKGLNKNFAAQMTELQPGIEKGMYSQRAITCAYFIRQSKRSVTRSLDISRRRRIQSTQDCSSRGPPVRNILRARSNCASRCRWYGTAHVNWKTSWRHKGRAYIGRRKERRSSSTYHIHYRPTC